MDFRHKPRAAANTRRPIRALIRAVVIKIIIFKVLVDHRRTGISSEEEGGSHLNGVWGGKRTEKQISVLERC